MSLRLIFILLLCQGLAFGAPAPVPSASGSFPGEAEAQKCQDRIAAVRRDVLSKYDDALAELQLGVQKTGDLEGALAIRAERQRVASEQSLTEENLVAEPKALRAVQSQSLAKMQELAAQLIAETVPKLIEYKKQLTIAGKLDDAVAVRAAIEQLQNANLPAARVAAGTVVPAETLLMAYGADRARADKTYKGQKIVVRGIVGGFRPDANDARAYQIFVTGGSMAAWVQCTFGGNDHHFREEKAAFNVPVLVISGKDAEAGIARVTKGATMDIRGVCEGWDETVRLVKCDVSK